MKRRNSDESTRALERAAAAGDRQSALRYALALRREGRLDPHAEVAAQLLDESVSKNFLASWVMAPGSGRIRLYRAIFDAGVRYPSAAHLAALNDDERLLCLVSSVWGLSDSSWNGIRGLGLHDPEGRIDIVWQDRSGFMHAPDREGNSHLYSGDEGLERARSEAAVVERDWAPLAGMRYDHKDGGFAETMTFLTPTGYARKTFYFHGDNPSRGTSRGVSDLRYDVRNGFFADTGDAIMDIASRVHLTPSAEIFASEVHALELDIHKLITKKAGRRAIESVPSNTANRALLAYQQSSGLVFFDAPASLRDSTTISRCLVVVPRSADTPLVTIGVGALNDSSRLRAVNPSHFWQTLAPWGRGLPNRKLEQRLADWAATPSDDRVRVNADVALVWSVWWSRMNGRLSDLYVEARRRERAELERGRQI